MCASFYALLKVLAVGNTVPIILLFFVLTIGQFNPGSKNKSKGIERYVSEKALSLITM